MILIVNLTVFKKSPWSHTTGWTWECVSRRFSWGGETLSGCWAAQLHKLGPRAEYKGESKDEKLSQHSSLFSGCGHTVTCCLPLPLPSSFWLWTHCDLLPPTPTALASQAGCIITSNPSFLKCFWLVFCHSNRKNVCYSLNLKCPLKVPVMKVGFPGHKCWGGDL